MTTTDVRHLLQTSSCWIAGATFMFDLDWMAVEKPTDAAVPPRMLLRVKARRHDSAQHATAAQLLVLTTAVSATDLMELLTDALDQHLAEVHSRAAVQRPVIHRRPAGMPS